MTKKKNPTKPRKKPAARIPESEIDLFNSLADNAARAACSAFDALIDALYAKYEYCKNLPSDSEKINCGVCDFCRLLSALNNATDAASNLYEAPDIR